MRWASHTAAFLAGALVATALAAHAVPQRRRDRARDRYASLDTFAQALSYIRNHYAEEIGERELLYGAVRGMVERLDSHSTFYPPNRYRQLRQDTEGEYGGVGLTLRRPSRDEPPFAVVASVVSGSPADRAGLREGDRILEIGRRATGGEGGLAGSVEDWHGGIRGRTGTRVRLEVMRRGWDRSRERLLVRERIKLPTVNARAVGDGVGYLAIERFQEATARDVKAALERLEAEHGRIRGLVLDLRDNPGGLLDQAVRVADFFLEEGTIVTVRGRRSRVERESAHAGGTFSRFPLVVLVDGGSASAAEIVAAALQDHDRAVVVGTPTYGKGSVQTFLDLEDGSGLKLTTSRYYTPSGRTLQDTGIKPDVLARAERGRKKTSRKGAEDSQLSAAYRTLRKRLRGGRP